VPAAALLSLSLWIVFINTLTFALFRLDKRRAIAGAWRIPEAHLLLAAVLGGSVGARIGQILLRHKTRKQPFRSLLNLVLALQLGVLVIITALALSPTLAGHARSMALSLLLPEATLTNVADNRRAEFVTIRRGMN